jgi:hypothetical protein
VTTRRQRKSPVHKNGKPEPKPTWQQVKVLLESLPREDQRRLFDASYADRTTVIGGTVYQMLLRCYEEIERLERLFGTGIGQFDPKRLLTTTETDKEAAKRTGYSVAYVKNKRCRLRKDLKKLILPGQVSH